MNTRHKGIRKALRLGTVAVLPAGLLWLAGCASAPRTELSAYLSSFSTVRTTAEDLYIRAGVLAEDIAQRPEKESNLSERLTELQQRRQALDDRLEAMRLIERYNSLIAHLAAGEVPKDLKAGISAFRQNLSAFKISGLTRLARKASSVIDLAAEGISLIDDAIKKKKFEKAVLKAQAPMVGIIDLLLEDAGDLETLMVQELRREQDVHREKVDSYGSRYYKRVKTLKPSDELDKLTLRHNEVRQRQERDGVPVLAHKPEPDAAAATPTDLELLAIMVDQADASVLAYNDVEKKIRAQRAVLEGYRKALRSTKKAFVDLAAAVEQGRSGATLDFALQAMEFRKAVMQFQEVR